MSEPCPQESGVHDQPRSDAGAAGDCSSQDHSGQPVANTASGQSTTDAEKMPATIARSTFEGRKARYLTMYALECPQTAEERKAFVSRHSLRNGDVVAFSDYRDTDSHIAFEDGDLKGVDLILIRNPDLRNAGYLTIPKEVLANIHDSVGFYGDIITPDAPSVTLLMSPKDKFIVDRFGEVPGDCEFYADFGWGELDFFGVRAPGCDDWKEFDPETVTREEIDKWYSQISPCDSESESVHPDAPSVILLVSPRDKFVVDRLGAVPDDWEFWVEFCDGELEDCVYVRVPGHDWEDFDSDTLTKDGICQKFQIPLDTAMK